MTSPGVDLASLCVRVFLGSFVAGTERQPNSIPPSSFASRQDFLPVIIWTGPLRPASRSHVFVDSSRLLLIARASLCLFHALPLARSQIARSAVDFVLGVVRSFLTSALFLESCDVFGQPQLQISPPGSLRSFSGIQ